MANRTHEPGARQLKGVLFDLDGTLVDSNDAHARAFLQAFQEAGYATTHEQVRRVVGMGGDQLLPAVIGVSNQSIEGKRISARRKELYRALIPSLRPFPDARALLQRVHDDGKLVVIASSSEEDEVRALLDILTVSDLVDVRTSTSDARASKPDPDILIAALRRARLHEDDAVMIGDTPYDAEAARAAGLGFVGFRCGGWSDRDLGGALAIYDGPRALLLEYDRSVLAGA